MHLRRFLAVALAVCGLVAPVAIRAQQASGTILKASDTPSLLPERVFYRGQSAPTQLRNSGGVKFADGYFFLTTLVDTSGYSTGVAAKYQAYFIAEVPLRIGGQALAAGVYGAGFIDGDKFVLTDVGGHDVLTVATSTDEALKRPMPLQVLADPSGAYRLYAGRRYVVFTR